MCGAFNASIFISALQHINNTFFGTDALEVSRSKNLSSAEHIRLVFHFDLFFHVISALWTEDMYRYVQFLERNLSWVVFPVLLSDKLRQSIDLKLFKKVFFIGLVIFALINEVAIIYDFITTTAHEKTVRLFFSRYYQLSNSIRISDIHYPYLSLYNTIAIIFGISIMRISNKSFWTATGLFLLLFYNFQLGSRVFFVINFIFFFYACVVIFLNGDKYLKFFLDQYFGGNCLVCKASSSTLVCTICFQS